MKLLSLTLLGIVLSASAVKVTYENYKVFKITPTSEEQVQILTDLQKDGSYEFWTDVINVNGDVRIMVAPEAVSGFVQYSASVGLNAVEAIPDVQKLIDAQRVPAAASGRSSGSMTWDRYYDLEQIYDWLDELVELYPGIVTTVNIGNSYEGRQIKGVIIDFKPDERDARPLTGMIEGGIHSREWISPATVTWIINEFLTSNDAEIRFMAEEFVWHIFPVVNPDGYVYTFTDNRMWRKNRNPENYVNCTGNNDLSRGTDLNRNFDFVWMTTGASQDPCAQTYAGSSPASEPETRAIANYVLTLTQYNNMVYYLAFHSYTQLVLVPFSFVNGQDKLQVPNYADLYEIAMRAGDKITEVHGTTYTIGVSGEILYETSGSSFDWAKGVAEVAIVYLFELRDLGEYGFLLPSEQIIPNNEEVMAGLVEMDRVVRKLGYYTAGSSAIFSSVAVLMSAVTFLIYAH